MAPQELVDKLTYDDLASTPNDGNRYELLDGRLFVTPSPNPRHQRASKRLQRQLEAYFEDHGLGEVFNAPLDVILTTHDVVEPDLIIVTDKAQVTARAIEGPPTIVVEVLSPSTRIHDRTVKSKRYATLGVEHFWIVDIKNRCLECYRLSGGRYVVAVTVEGDDPFTHPDWPDLTIDVGALWREN